MQGEKDAKPGKAEIILIICVISLTFEEINQVIVSYHTVVLYIILN